MNLWLPISGLFFFDQVRAFLNWQYVTTRCITKVTKKRAAPSLWHYRLSRFHAGGTKVKRFLPKSQHTQRKFLNLSLSKNQSFRRLCHSSIIFGGNWDTHFVPKMSGKNTHIYFFYFSFKNKQVWAEKIGKKQKNSKNLRVASNYPKI